ncbi:hypothetical protein [Aliiglaciecola sp. LCG003]|uniref:hypothetical protein n=1 Tax=Aliiglaciecola sp. LCG003 TaxID=3053655 RepID=UPI0025737925|nr:hypothetical protein [Aliiglaciecola sp. LCG003]WJG09332.1 hypothetical protein QR722_18685 [Aliiglaciecola sp. LCG003]
MLKHWFYRLGSQPHKSWADFKIGLAIFVFGIVLILAGNRYWIMLQIPGVLVLAGGFIYAAKGYAGIFANRFSQTINRLSAAAEKDKRNTHQD